jgi:hypothetical protein
MEYLRVIRLERIPWQAYLMVALCLAAGGPILYLWNRQWTRVSPGAEAWAPNAAIAAAEESRMQAEAAGKPITDVMMILAPHDWRQAAGKRVQLDSVGVRWTAGGRGFAVSQMGTPPVFVALATPLNADPNRCVSLTGVLEPVPGRSQLRERFPMLGDRQLDELERDRLWVAADHVEVEGWY